MKCHTWTVSDDRLLLEMVAACKPLFLHYSKQGGSYSERNAWDSVAGRMLPSVCVTGAACRRRFARLRKEQKVSDWDSLADRIAEIERGLLESTYDCVRGVDSKIDVLMAQLEKLNAEVACLKDLWR